MFTIFDNGTIYVNRGDSFQLPIKLNLGSNLAPVHHKLNNNSFVYVGVMEPNQQFEDAIVRKKLTKSNQLDDGTVIVEFTPQDTQCLLPGKYYYQVKLQEFDSNDLTRYTVTTVIDKTLIFILE